jgi:hypothetical protein
VTLSFRRTPGRVIWANDLGHFTILTGLGGPVGPGYISRFKTRSGVLLNDDLRAGSGFINDPRYGGLGTFGWHHARRIDRHGIGPEDQFGAANPGAPSDWLQNNAWPIDGRHLASRCDGFGVTGCVTLHDPEVANGRGRHVLLVEYGDPWDRKIATATYSYTFAREAVEQRIAVTFRVPAGPPAFVKEPRVCYTAGRPPGFTDLYVRQADGRLRRWRGKLPRTGQAQPGPRLRMACGMHPSFHVEVEEAFDGWAEAAATRPRFGEVDSPGDGIVWDCHGGVPRSRFEMIRWESCESAFLLCAWQGGRGPYDCEPLSRAIADESHGLAVTIRVGR